MQSVLHQIYFVYLNYGFSFQTIFEKHTQIKRKVMKNPLESLD